MLAVFKRKSYTFLATTPKRKCVSREKCVSDSTSQHLQAGPSTVQESTSAEKPAPIYLIHFPDFFFPSSNTFVISIIKTLYVCPVLPA